eukprot:m.37823 g.37823  ORF g.37823 m.37823 type:complete len:219 (+) comp32452_c0_seq2:1504-2160(+)
MYDTYEAEKANEIGGGGVEINAPVDDDAVLERPSSRQVRAVSSGTDGGGQVLRTPSVIGSSVSESRTSLFTSVLSSETASARGGVLLRQQGQSATPDDDGPLELPLDPILKSDELMTSLQTMEKVVMMNVYQSKQAKYRGLPVLGGTRPAPGQTQMDKPVLERLWTYSCPLTADKCVCAMAWNRSNQARARVADTIEYFFSNTQHSNILRVSILQRQA